MLDHDEVEDAADRTHHRVLPTAFLAPFGAHALARARAEGYPVPAHHRIEQGARLLAAVMALALEGAVDLGGDREAHLAAEHHGVFARQGVEAGNATAEAFRRQHGGFQHRAGIAVADHSQDRFHRGPIPPPIQYIAGRPASQALWPSSLAKLSGQALWPSSLAKLSGRAFRKPGLPSD